MKRYTVRVLERAKREYAIASAWWHTHRPAAPTALRDEFQAARVLLAHNPEAGHLDEGQAKEIRRLILPAVRYLIYYSVDHASREIRILAFWHASRLPPEF